MTEKTMKSYRLALAVILALIVGWAVNRGNIVAPIIAIVAALILVFILRKKVTDIVVDERVTHIRQKASRATISVFAVGAALLSIIFTVLTRDNPALFGAGQTLAYAACAMLILDSLFYYYYNKKG